MKITITILFLCMLLAVSAVAAGAKEFVLIDAEEGTSAGDWFITDKQLGISGSPSFIIENRVLQGGRQAGSEVLSINCNGFSIRLSPTRGMGILSVTGNGVRLGWDSPVDEVVNPAYINLESRRGFGWLEGFNEMMVRCGFEWTGRPVEADGMLYTLHGRAGNTPVSRLIVSVDEDAPHTVSLKGLIKENALGKGSLETWTELRYVPGSSSFTVHDVVTNRADYARDCQIIYRSSFGPPLLEEGATFSGAVQEITPFDAHAAKGLDAWQTYLGPTKNFGEMVYNIVPLAGKDHKAVVMLANKAGAMGAGITFDVRELPVFSLWKNTDTLKQGYATGFGPGTSFVCPVTMAREQGLVRKLDPGESATFTLEYALLADARAVAEFRKKIDEIRKQNPVMRKAGTPE